MLTVHGQGRRFVSQLDALAVRVGFEPTRQFPVYTLSKRAPSTTRPPHQADRTHNDLMIVPKKELSKKRPKPQTAAYCMADLTAQAVPRLRRRGGLLQTVRL